MYPPPNSLPIVSGEIAFNKGVVGFFALDEQKSCLGAIHKHSSVANVCADINDMYETHFLGNIVSNFVELHIVSGVEFLIEKNRVGKWHSQGVTTKF